MTGSGQSIPRQSSSRSAVTVRRPVRISATTSGSTARNAVDVGLGRVAGQRDPDVAVGEGAHRGQHVARLEGGGGAGRAARDLEAAAVERVDDRLAVDVEEREGHQVGEPVDRVADDLGVGDLGHRGPDPVDEGVLAGVDLVALGDHGLERRRGAEGGRDVLEAGDPLVDPVVLGERVAPRRPLADQQHADPGRAAPLVRRAGGHRPALGERQPAHRGAGVHEQRLPPRRQPRRRAGRCRPRGWRTGARPRRARRGRSRSTRPSSVDRDRRAPAGRAARPARAGRPSARPRRAPPRRPAGPGPSRPRCTASVPEDVNDTSSRRTPSASATASPGVVEDQPGVAGGGVQAARIGVPLVERGEHRVAGRRVQRLGGRGVDVHAAKTTRQEGTHPAGFRGLRLG